MNFEIKKFRELGHYINPVSVNQLKMLYITFKQILQISTVNINKFVETTVETVFAYTGDQIVLLYSKHCTTVETVIPSAGNQIVLLYS